MDPTQILDPALLNEICRYAGTARLMGATVTSKTLPTLTFERSIEGLRAGFSSKICAERRATADFCSLVFNSKFKLLNILYLQVVMNLAG